MNAVSTNYEMQYDFKYELAPHFSRGCRPFQFIQLLLKQPIFNHKGVKNG